MRSSLYGRDSGYFKSAKNHIAPDPFAGCPMADMITAEKLKEKKKQHPGCVVIAYVNSSAAVKAETDLCCTSSNALKIVESVPKDQEILFVPDMHLGHYVQDQLDRPMIIWDGYCPTHSRIRDVDILREKEDHPRAKIMAHPECPPSIRSIADYLLSTGQMIEHAKNADEDEFIVALKWGYSIGCEMRIRIKSFTQSVIEHYALI